MNSVEGDQIKATGNVTLGGSSTIQLDAVGGGAVVPNMQSNLIESDSQIFGDFANKDLGDLEVTLSVSNDGTKYVLKS